MTVRILSDCPSDRTIVRLVTERGLSSYEIAVRNGYEGTEAAWIESFGGVLIFDGGNALTGDSGVGFIFDGGFSA